MRTIIKEDLWRAKDSFNRADPGETLLEGLVEPMRISINRLAQNIAVRRGRIGAIVNGQRAITADTAVSLGKYFGVSSELWLGLQADLDLRIAKRTVGAKLARQVRAHVA